MPIKVILNAKAVRELIDLDEGPIAEVAKNATHQVATLLADKLMQTAIERRIEAVLFNSTYSGRLSIAAKTEVQRLLQGETTHFVASVRNGVIRDEIRALVEPIVMEIMHQRRKTLSDEIDMMLRTRFAAMFTPPG